MLKQLLFSCGISLIGMAMMYTTGFLFLHALPAVKHLNMRERLFFAPTLFFAYALIVFSTNWITQGRLLSSLPLLWIFFTASLTTLWWAGHHKTAKTLICLRQKIQEGGWQGITDKVFFPEQTIPEKYGLIHRYRFHIFCLIIIAATLISCAPVLLGERFDVDALDHLMWTNQFLNGRTFSTLIPYRECGNPEEMYPFIVHVTAAFFTRLFQVEAETGIIITTVIQALLYPLGLYFLILKMTCNYRIALLAMVTGCFYFGHDYLLGLWWFNIPVQRLDMANNVCRMMSMAMAPFILYLFKQNLHEKSKSTWSLTGLLTGIAGLIHPYFYSYAVTFLLFSISYFAMRKDWQTTKKLFGVLLCSLTLFSIILIPYFPVSSGGALTTNRFLAIPQGGGSLSQVIITPYEYLVSYGFIGILALLSLYTLRERQDKTFTIVLSTTILVLIAFTWAKEVIFIRYNISVPYNPAQHKYGNTLFLICIILSSIFIQNLSAEGPFLKIWSPKLVSILLIALTLGTMPNLNVFRRYFIERDPFFSQYRAPDNIFHLIKIKLQPEDVLAVPNWWTRRFASFTGKDLLFINENNYYTPYRELANILLYLPAGKKQAAIAKEAGIEYKKVVQHIISYFMVDAVITPNNLAGTFRNYSFLNHIGTGSTHLPSTKKIIFDIYQVKRKNNILQSNKYIIEKILTNRKIYQIATGAIPLVTERYVRLGIYNQRRKNFISLAFISNKIFAINSTDHIVFEIDPDTGRIIRRIQLPVPPSAIAGFKNDLYIYSRKDKALRKINLKKTDALKNLGIVSVPVGKIGSITFDERGWLWFFVWSRLQKQYLLYSHNLSTQQTVQAGKLPRKQIYTGLAFEKNGGSILISTKRGFYFRWSPEEQKIITRYYNGRIRPFGICMINSSLYAYNGFNHLIGKLGPMKK